MFGPGFILLPAGKDAVFQKQSRKRYALMAFGSGSLKVIFELLTEVVIFYVQVAIIEIRLLGL